ncbi:MAG: DUF4338 domain-containing protein [Mariprofundaceae bacterium]
MSKTIICQGREVCGADIDWLQACVREHPDWSRHRITKHICEDWDWRTHSGQLKTFAARSFIDKLEAKGFIELPPVRAGMRRPHRDPYPEVTLPDAAPVTAQLSDIAPVSITLISSGTYDHGCFASYLIEHHYLGFNRTVGEHLEYLVRDAQGCDLACVLFGSAAWKCASRDRWIGWDATSRQRNLNFTTNNTRFLILPWVRIPHLASHILGRIMRRLSHDWLCRYGHPVHLVETFVEKDRFKGTCYKAANWTLLGQTQGRSRQDRHNNLSVPVKDILAYPLCKNFRHKLCAC